MTSAPSPASSKPQYSAVSSAYSMAVRPESIPGASDGARPSGVRCLGVLTDSSVMMVAAEVQAAFAVLMAEALGKQDNALYVIIGFENEGLSTADGWRRADIRNVMGGNAGAERVH